MKRPLLYCRLARDYYRTGWHFVLIFAPWPAEEQEPGTLCAALLNLEMHFNHNPLRFFVHAYCADPADRPTTTRKGEGV